MRCTKRGGVVEETVFVGHDAQAAAQACSSSPWRSRKSGREGLPTLWLPSAKVS
jgi:hypothetical protein